MTRPPASSPACPPPWPEPTTYTYTAGDTDGSAAGTDEATLTVSITVNAAAGTDTAPTFGAVTISPQTFTIGTAVDLTLPVATGGEGAIVYALTPAAPAGLTFIPATRVLSGTPNTQASATTYTYTAGDTDGSTAGTDEATLTFTIAVNAAAATVPTFGDATIGDLTYAIGTAVDLTLPVATGSDTLFYSVRGATLPDGLTFNTGTRVLSGMPTTAGFTMHSYRVANVFARAVALMFTITITDPDAPDTPPAFADGATVAAQTFTMGTAVDLTLPRATGGNGAITYTLTPATPTGVNFDAATRVLSGMPSTVAAATTYTYTAGDTDGSDAGTDEVSLTFTITVNAAPAAVRPVFFQVASSVFNNYDEGGTAVGGPTTFFAEAGTETVVLTLTGADAAFFSITQAGALSFNPAPDFEMPRGMAPSSSNTNTYRVTVLATASGGLTQGQSVEVRVVDVVNEENTAPAFPGGTSVTIPTFTVGQMIDTLTLPVATGGNGALTYTLTGALPAGLTFNAAARPPTLTGTPTSTTVAPVYMYVANDGDDDMTAGDTATLSLSITVNAAPVSTPPTTQTLTISPTMVTESATATNITATVTLNGGTYNVERLFNIRTTQSGPATAVTDYTVFSNVVLTIPANMASGSQTFPFTAIDDMTADDGETLRIDSTLLRLTGLGADTSLAVASATLTINDPVAGLTFGGETVGDQTYFAGTAITSLTLPVATGGDGAITYTLTPALPTGLTYNATARTITGTASAATTVRTYTYTATDADNAAATLMFSITIDTMDTAPTFAADERIDAQTLLQNIAIPAVTLPEATGGNGALTYTLTPTIPGLTLNPSTRVLTGTPTTEATAQTITYTATDADNDTATLTVRITVTANQVPAFSAGATIPAQTYTVDMGITALTLPTATGGNGAITYALTGPNANELPPGLTFDTATRVLSGTPTTATVPLTFTWTAADTDANTAADGDAATLTFTITVNPAGIPPVVIAALNQAILPEATRALVNSTTSSITQRIGRAVGGAPQVGSLNFAGQSMGGQDNLAAALRTHGEAMTADSRDIKEMLADSDFVLPLNPIGTGGGSSLAFWGSGEYLNFSGGSGSLDWNGDLSGFQLGLDARLRDDLLLGVAVSLLESDADYKGAATGLGSGEYSGEYTVDMTSMHPYIGWSSGGLDWWATVGAGSGELKITTEETGVPLQDKHDIDMQTVSVGSSLSFQAGATTLRLKGEVAESQVEVEGSSDMDELQVGASRIRVAMEVGQSRWLPGGRVFEPSVEVAMRYDDGDGETGGGAEIGGGLRYDNPAKRFTVDGRARALLGHGGGYEEWGVSGTLRVTPDADGQGASFSVSPGYGNSGSGIQELWRQGLADDDAATTDSTDDYAMKLDARVGYGLGFTLNQHHGILTPYSEMTLGTTDSYRMGLNWAAGTRFDLTLLGERREPTTNPAEHAVLLKGEVRF